MKEKRAVNGTSEVALDCSDIQDLAEALLDNETLTEVERSDVAEHLASCDTCRAEYDMDSATKMLVHSRIPLVATPSTAYETIRHIIGEV